MLLRINVFIFVTVLTGAAFAAEPNPQFVFDGTWGGKAIQYRNQPRLYPLLGTDSARMTIHQSQEKFEISECYWDDDELGDCLLISLYVGSDRELRLSEDYSAIKVGEIQGHQIVIKMKSKTCGGHSCRRAGCDLTVNLKFQNDLRAVRSHRLLTSTKCTEPGFESLTEGQYFLDIN